MLILGHRGSIVKDPTALYSNSYPAFDLALHYADGFETDACVSKDGIVFLAHEAKYINIPVEYCLNEHLEPESSQRLGDRRFDQVEAEELRTFRLISGEPIPELKEVIKRVAAHQDKVLNLELKGYNSAVAVLRDIDWAVSQGLMRYDQFIISSFNHLAISEIRKNRSDIILGFIFALDTQVRTPLFLWLENAKQKGWYEPFSSDYLYNSFVQEIAPDYVVIAEPILNEENARAIKDALPDTKIAAWVFTELEESTDQGLEKKIETLVPKGLLDAIMPDNIKETAPKIRQTLKV